MLDTVQNIDLPLDDKRELLKTLLSLRQPVAGAGIPLSYNQQALWFVHHLAPASPAYNFLFAARIAGPLDKPALMRAFASLVRRHPALRTRFAVRDNKPVQIIEETMVINIPVRDVSGKSAQAIEELCKRRADEPFDLERGPALCAELLAIAPTETVLLLVCHHIIIDLWSMDLLVSQLAEAYAAEIAGTPIVALAPEASSTIAPFVDYIRHQLGAVHGARGRQAWDYWRRQLAGELPVLNLPTDRSRPVVQTYNGASHTWPLPHDVVQGLRAAAQVQGATPFVALLAVFQTLLYRYTGQDDFLVGTATADRARPEWQQAVGYFLNQVALRANVTGGHTFQTLLARTRDQVYQALEHQDFPFGLLVKRLQPRRDPSRSPIFQVMFIWDKTHLLAHPAAEQREGARAGLKFEPLLMEQRGAPFDLTLIIFETGDRLTASLRFNTDLFDTETIARMAGHFNRLLAGLTAAPQSPLSEVAMLSPSERTCILETWNDTARPGAHAIALPQLFEEHAAKAPEADAILFEEQTISYGDLNHRANQLARYLQRLGVSRGQTVAISMPRCPEVIVAVLAAWKMGAPYLYLDPLYPINRLSGMIQDARPAALIASVPMTGVAVPAVHLPGDCAAISSENQANLGLSIGPDDLAYIIYTSGSTGQPKGTLLRHRGLSNLRLAQEAVFGPGPGDRVLQYASLSFDASVFEIAMALGSGAALVLGRQSSLMPGPGLLDLLRQHAVTIATLPPSVPAILSPTPLPALHTLIVAGEACSADVVSAWGNGRRVFNAYGPTEATVWSTVAECVADGRPPSIGRPIANTRAYILDGDLQPVPVGAPGELYLAGVGLAAGYLNRPELTAERFIANPFSTADEGLMYRTGDLARWRDNGEIEFIGRRDLQLKLRGYRVELEEIQEVLRQHADVADALVIAKKGADGQTTLIAYVVPSAAAGFSLAEVRAYLRAHLPHYMIPANVLVLERFPVTVSGKVDRDRLPEPTMAEPMPRPITAARRPVEKLLAGIWATVLRVETIGIHNNFFDLGGASIQTLEVVAQANQAGLDITPEMIFRYQTIAELADVCASALPKPEANGCHQNGTVSKRLAKTSPAAKPQAAPARNGTGGGALVESLGVYLPPREVTTEQVLRDCRIKLDFPLERMTGIHTRRMAGETEFAIDLAARAITDCLNRSTYAPADIDLLLCSNISRYDAPNSQFTMEPTTAARLRARFGFTNALAFDVTNACAGTFTALHLVDILLRQGVIRRAMVVSGEYITHLTLAAQREIESFMDPRLACLTLGDSGMAMILEQAPNPNVGFQEIDLYTLGKYHDLCVAKASANPEGGAIMFTDPVKSAAVTIKEAVKHCLEALERNHWTAESLKWLIMHQTSEVTLDGAIREINRAAGKQVARRDNTVFHLARRGNTATNSHFLALREHIDEGKIAAGDKVFFAVSGSGQVVGSALYIFDDLPNRMSSNERKAHAEASETHCGLRMFPCARRARIAGVGLLPNEYAGPTESVALLKAAGEACLGGSTIRREQVDLVIHCGTYRSEFLCEPALAAIAAGELAINHDDENPTGKRTFAFDLTNGAAGTLTACFLAGQMLGASKYTRALILASEVENNAAHWPEHLLGLKVTASALLLEQGSAGFVAFGTRTFPEHIGCAEAFTVSRHRRPALSHRHDPDYESLLRKCIRATVPEFLAQLGMDTSDMRWFLLPQRSAAFVAQLADALALPPARVVFVADGQRDYFTSSLALAYNQVRPSLSPGDRLLMVEAAAGIQITCALYEV